MSIVAGAARRFFEALLAALLPADCLLCERSLPWRQRGGVCHSCWQRLPWAPGRRTPPASSALEAILWAADYAGPIRRLIHGLKFESMDYLADYLGGEAAYRLAPLIGGRRLDVVVPVPLHWWRRYRRGYNQAMLLAEPLARALGAPLARRLLARRRAGRRQLGLSRRERLRSLRGCYAVRRGAGRGLSGKRVLLVDDVVTTGATLEACARALRRAGAGVVVACVLARTPRSRARLRGPLSG